MTIPFLDLSRQTASLRGELDAAITRVLAAGRFVLGEEVELFESEFAEYLGVEYVIGVASGTDALTIALQAVAVGPGDEVVTVANTCVPTIAGIEATGAKPVLADVDPHTYTLDPARVEHAISPRTKAIVPVHLYGQTADLTPVLELAARHGLEVVEDCAQAHGAEYGGRRAGTCGRAAAFSFYPTKNLGALGDAGAVATSDPEVAKRAALLRNYGEEERFRHVLRGRNSRLDSLQAAILSTKLAFLDGWNERRRAIAAVYTEALSDSPVVPPTEASGRRHVYHLYVVRAPERDRFRALLAERGVETAIHYPIPVHRQPAYTDVSASDLTVTERLATEIVSLPLAPELTDEEVSYVGQAARDAARAIG